MDEANNKTVLSLNFHPFYSNEDKIYHREQFHADYCTFRFPENIFTKATAKLNKLEEALSEDFQGPYPDNPDCRKRMNFIIVGPFKDKAKNATVNLFLERQKNACRFAKHCLLMYLRPIKIGPRAVQEFCTYTPPADLFRKSSEKSSEGDSYYLQKGHFKHGKNFEEVLRSKNNSRHSESGTSIRFKRSDNGDLKIVADAESNETACRFEITIFEYKGVIERPPTLPPGASPYVPAGESHVGNIALIIPSQMLPELERDNIRKFMDGKMAIQLQARVPGSPIQFILPSASGHEEAPNNDANARAP